MPLYDFQCSDCRATFEELVKSAQAADAVRCAKCGSPRVERLIATFAAGTARSPGGSASPGPSAAPRRGGGGCGPGCGCHA